MSKKDDDVIYDEGCPSWMLTMGDSMSLLLTFFVLLMSFSTPNEHQLMDVFGGIQGALSLIPPSEAAREQSLYKQQQDQANVKGKMEKGLQEQIQIDRAQLAPVDLRSMTVVNRYNDFKDRIQMLGFKNIINTYQIQEGIVIVANANVLFKMNSAEINPKGMSFLQNLVNLISSIGNEVRVNACFRLSNSLMNAGNGKEWQLARKRAVGVADYLSEKYAIPKYRFSYGLKVITEDVPDYMQFIIVEKLKTKEVDIARLMNMNPSEEE